MQGTKDSSVGDHVAYLDGWRGMSITLLLIGHFFPVPGINLGIVGVHLFFVLSGLLMARLLFMKGTPLGTFYRRRISRILPAHLVFIFAMAVLWTLGGLPFSARETFSALFFYNNYVGPMGGPGSALMPFGHIWSLSVEEHSYILLASVALVSRSRVLSLRACLAGLLTICVVSSISYAAWDPPNLEFSQWLHTEVAGFGVLMSAALFVLLSGQAIPKAAMIIVPILMLGGMSLHWWSVPILAQQLVGVACFALAVNWVQASPRWMIRIFTFKPLCQLGAWSYSIYLWQQPFYLWAHQDHHSRIVGLLCAIASGLLSFYLLEQPVRRYLNLRWNSWKYPFSKKLA